MKEVIVKKQLLNTTTYEIETRPDGQMTVCVTKWNEYHQFDLHFVDSREEALAFIEANEKHEPFKTRAERDYIANLLREDRKRAV